MPKFWQGRIAFTKVERSEAVPIPFAANEAKRSKPALVEASVLAPAFWIVWIRFFAGFRASAEKMEFTNPRAVDRSQVPYGDREFGGGG